MQRKFDLVIIDSEPFGLSAEDAAEIIRKVAPGSRSCSSGKTRRSMMPKERSRLDLEEFKRTIHSIAV